ncbi:mitochondrion biogenesis protein [Lasallia pustulata]|uniref:Sensitive to high expression protein 9, mitochondrial n=1 Tax=Lasallia pustulata TaxID=136370 RepID=A0A1W5DAW4_9LECA|nr:mitochondrion biogenesis protein [Lasallia pustulata]
MDHLQSNIFIAGQRLNDLTGYSGIEALKKDIEEQEEYIKVARAALQKAKEDYSASIAQRSASQREVNELLQRKHAWSPQDLERFTSLYRSDHANEQAESAAQEALMNAERKAEEAAGKLSASILARYHEEQIWSDKIRRMSTWGTWGLMGVNVLLFLVFQIAVEPWRRRRLVKGFEEKVMEALDREGAATNATPGAVLAAVRATGGKDAEPAPSLDRKVLSIPEAVPTAQEAATSVEKTVTKPEVVTTVEEAKLVVEDTVPAEANTVSRAETESATGDATKPGARTSMSSMIESYKEVLRDLFSERQVQVRRVDLTTVALEGAAAGMAFVGILVVLLRPR